MNEYPQPSPRPIRVFLARHAAPALPDDRRRFLGQTDLPLGPRGQQQAEDLALRLREMRLSAIYCSDLARSRQTAAVVARGRDLVPQELTWLREIDAGSWELLTFEDARRLYPREYALRDSDLAGTPFPGGESLRDLEARVLPGFLALLDESSDGILIVGHRAVNVVLLSRLQDLSLDQAFTIPQEYCALSIIETGRCGDGRRWFSVRADAV